MPFTHHSHSGQFCRHAKNTLEQMVKAAIKKRMETIVLTEHMPRNREQDLYPEEREAGITVEDLFKTFDDYYREAKRLQEAYKDKINILVGFEAEWIRSSSKQLVESLLTKYQFDTFIGSVHFVGEWPIDYDMEHYRGARMEIDVEMMEEIGDDLFNELDVTGDELLHTAYYKTQLEMLKALRPPIVGHFDLIRYKSYDPDATPRSPSRVWRAILHNLQFIADYGGVLELSSAAIRKKMEEPYPVLEICLAWLGSWKGKFCLSDDSHSFKELGWGYRRMIKYMAAVNINELAVFEKNGQTKDPRFPGVSTRTVTLESLLKHDFFCRDLPRSLEMPTPDDYHYPDEESFDKEPPDEQDCTVTETESEVDEFLDRKRAGNLTDDLHRVLYLEGLLKRT